MEHYKHNPILTPLARSLRMDMTKVVRIPNTEIHKKFKSVCIYIDWMVQKRLNHVG